MPETPEEISAFFTKMEEKDKDVRLDLHFSQPELDKMTDFEKLRLGNLKRNYQTMKELGKYYFVSLHFKNLFYNIENNCEILLSSSAWCSIWHFFVASKYNLIPKYVVLVVELMYFRFLQ